MADAGLLSEQLSNFTIFDNTDQKIVGAIFDKYHRLRKELNIGWNMSDRNLTAILVARFGRKDDPTVDFSKVGEGAYGECYRFKTTGFIFNRPAPNMNESLIAKKLKEGTRSEVIEEAARLLLITSLGHYGIVESYAFEKDDRKYAVLLFQYDSSENITLYIAMEDIEGKALHEAIEENELTDYHKLRIAVRVADTLKFLHSYKLAHCDLNSANIMLKEGTLDPVLIDLGSMRDSLQANYAALDTSDYHGLIYKMYRSSPVAKIPPVVKPIFDKWDDPDHYQMSLEDLTKKYFGSLSAYNTIVTHTSLGLNTTVPNREDGIPMFCIDFQAMNKSRGFTEYLERNVIKLEEQDTMIRTYVELSRKTQNKDPALKPPFSYQTEKRVQFWEFLMQEARRHHQSEN